MKTFKEFAECRLDEAKNPDKYKEVSAIAKKVMKINSLKPKGRDDDDFYEVHVKSIEDALKMAYDAGAKTT